MTLKFRRCVHVRYLRMCAKFHVSRISSCRENLSLSSCFSTSMSQMDFLRFRMTGANITGPVFLPKDTFIEQGCQFHYWSFKFAIFCHNIRRSDSAIASFLYFQNSRHLVVGPLHIFIHDPNQIITLSCLTSSLFHLLRTFHSGKYSFAHLVQIISE